MQLQWANSWHSTSSAGNAHIIHCLAATEVAARTQTGSGSPQMWIRMPPQEDKSSLYLQASSSAHFRLALTFSALLMAVWISSDTNQQNKNEGYFLYGIQNGLQQAFLTSEVVQQEKGLNRPGLPQQIHQTGTTWSRPRPLWGEKNRTFTLKKWLWQRILHLGKVWKCFQHEVLNLKQPRGIQTPLRLQPMRNQCGNFMMLSDVS